MHKLVIYNILAEIDEGSGGLDAYRLAHEQEFFFQTRSSRSKRSLVSRGAINIEEKTGRTERERLCFHRYNRGRAPD